jgi:hypothetical protein
MATLDLTWNGDVVKAKALAAAEAGVNRTMFECVDHAKRNHPWKNRSGILEGGVSVVSYATRVDGGVQGKWGVLDVRYALAQELGAIIRPVHAKAQADGSVRFVKQVTLPARPYLRPAADAKYPNLGANIRAAFESGARDG